MDISVVVPLFNEEESLPELVAWVDRIMSANKFTYEVVMIDDGSTDSSWEVITTLQSKYPTVRGIKFQRNYGKSGGLYCGFEAAQGDVIVTMDADLQDSPDEIPELYRMIIEDGYDMVSGWKKKRYDPILSKNIPSKFYNWTARRLTGIKLHDFNCGLKAYRKNVIKSIEVYGEMHRYIPVLAKWAGFKKIGEKVVQHQERKYGVTKFGLERFIRGPLDLLSVVFISKFSKRPMHFFGLLGTLTFLVGIGVSAWITAEKLILLSKGEPLREITEQPMFYFALVALIIGVQLFLTGFLAELVSRSSSDRNRYMIEKEI